MNPAEKILIVDDELGPRLSLKLLLGKKRGYQCFVCSDSVEAIAVLRANPDMALAILDLRMPGCMGTDLLVQLRSIVPDLRAVLFTAYNDLGEAVDGENKAATLDDLGFTTQLNKPSDEAAVAATVQFALSRPSRPILKDWRRTV